MSVNGPSASPSVSITLPTVDGANGVEWLHKIWNTYSGGVAKVTNAVPFLGETGKKILHQIIRVLIIALPVFLLIPYTFIYVPMIIIGAVAIIKPKVFLNHENLTTPVGQVFGCFSILECVKTALLISLTATPLVGVIGAMLAHFVIGYACFNFTNYIKSKEQDIANGNQLANVLHSLLSVAEEEPSEEPVAQGTPVPANSVAQNSSASSSSSSSSSVTPPDSRKLAKQKSVSKFTKFLNSIKNR